MDITLTQEQYEALIALAQRSTTDPDGSTNQVRAIDLNKFLADIEKKNNITRHSLWVRWQDPNAPLPPGIRFPKTWPPELQSFIQFLSRKVTKTDVMGLVNSKAPTAVNIMVTPDPAALTGWTKVDDYFHVDGG